RQSQELDELLAQGDLIEQVAGDFEAVARRGADLGQLLLLELAHQLASDVSAVIQGCTVVDPLPDLRARDLGGGGVFHQIENGCSTRASQPGLDVLDANADVAPDAGFGDLAAWHAQVEQLTAFDRDFGTLPIELIGTIAHELGKDL